MARPVLDPKSTTTAVREGKQSSPRPPGNLAVCCASPWCCHPTSHFWLRVWTQTLHSGSGSHHSTLPKPSESDPDKPWWGDSVRSASWRLNSNKKLRRKNDTAKKEFQVLLNKTVEELLGEGLVLFNIFLPWQPKNLDLSTSIHLLWYFFQNSVISYNSKTKNLVQVYLQYLFPKY